MKKYVSVLLFCFCCTIANAQDIYSKAKVYFGSQTLQDLARLGIPVDHGELKPGIFFISEFSAGELKKIKDAGFNYDIIIPDLTAYYTSPQNKIAARMISGCERQTKDYAVPQGFTLGSMGGFFRYEEMLAHLDSMAARFPNIITIKQPLDSTTTYEDRPVYWVKISDNAASKENEPEMLYTAVHHAREPGSLSSTIFYMYYLLENYNSDPEIKHLVDNTELYFIPCINPDGYSYNQTTNPAGGGMWRKNRVDNFDGTYGVDLNRNYGEAWGFDDNGSSPNSNSDTYRGPSPFSEAETKMVRDFCLNHDFKVALNFHSYGDLLIYPWGYLPGYLTPDSTAFKVIAGNMAHYNQYNCGTGDETVGYLTNGDSDDWMYGEQSLKEKIFAFTPEVGNSELGFWPDSEQIIPMCKDNMWLNLTAARVLNDYAIFKDNSSTFISTADKLEFSLQRLGLKGDSSFTVTAVPLDTFVTFNSSAKTFSNLSFLETKLDSFNYIVNPNTPQGQMVRYEVLLSSGSLVMHDTIEKIYGTPVTVFTADGTSLADWSGDWNTTATDYISSPSSITDSKSGNYSSNDNSELILNTPIDLKTSLKAYLNFWAKWEIEAGWDYAQIEASENRVSWTPLCGKYTKTGNANQAISPIYDGMQSTWVKEEIDLSDFAGKEVYLKFKLISDTWLQYDGFYFDDLSVITIHDSSAVNDTLSIKDITNAAFVKIYPNPAAGFLNITSDKANYPYDVEIYNLQGEAIYRELNLLETNKTLDISRITPGIYFLNILSAQGIYRKKIVILN